MSRVYFNDGEQCVELSGSERAHMNSVCNDLFLSAANLHYFKYADQISIWNRLRESLPGSDYVWDFGDRYHQLKSLETFLSVGSGRKIVVEGYGHSLFGVMLNTAYCMGSGPVKLMARIHGQCEVHGYIRGESRSWVANIIALGRGYGIYREQEGWEEVMDMLRSNSTRTVVTSYSVCDIFPCPYELQSNQGLEEDEREHYAEWFYSLPKEEQWQIGLGELYEQPLLEITPENWEGYYFDTGLTAFDWMNWVHEAGAKEREGDFVRA